MTRGSYKERESVAAADAPFKSVACAENVNTPIVEGRPDISPVVEFRVKPLGRLPDVIVHVYGGKPPAADRVA
jgi:hypothetical protein